MQLFIKYLLNYLYYKIESDYTRAYGTETAEPSLDAVSRIQRYMVQRSRVQTVTEFYPLYIGISACSYSSENPNNSRYHSCHAANEPRPQQRGSRAQNSQGGDSGRRARRGA